MGEGETQYVADIFNITRSRFKTRNIARLKEDNFVLIKRLNYQANIIMLNVYIHKYTAKNYVKQKMSK